MLLLIKKHRRLFLSIVPAIIVIVCGVYFRLYPITTNLEKRNLSLARLTIYVNLKKDIAEKTDKAFPGLPQDKKVELINSQFRKTMQEESKTIEKYAAELAKGASGNKKLFTFELLEADPYYYYYLTKKLVSSGVLSDKIKNGKFLDPFMLAPEGFWRNIEIHPYVGFITYKIFSLFHPHISLMMSVAAVPIILYVVSAVFFMWLISLFKIDKVFSIITGIFFSLSPIFIQRSSFGWYDTDLYNILFPTLILITLIKIFEKPDHVNKKMLFALSGLTALYALSWEGWFLILFLTTLSFLVVIMHLLITRKHPLAQLKNAAIYIVLSCVFLTVVLTPQGFVDSILKTFHILEEFLFLKVDIWPDIFLTVGELKPTSLVKLIHILGGHFFFYVSLFGIVVLLLNKKANLNRAQSIAICFFYLALLSMAKSAERFSLFFLLPVSVTFAIGIDKMFHIVKTFMNVFTKNAFRHIAIPIYALFTLSLIFPVVYAQTSASGLEPIFNNVWQKALEKIRTNTPTQSIINSWWPPGHFIKAIAERRVTFDGATMNTPQAYWMATFFMSQDEKEAISILRMLNTSGNRPAEFLVSNGLDLNSAVKLLKTIVVLKKDAARETLLGHLPEKKADELLALTHGTPPPAYCFIYNDVMESILGLYYVNEWDFKKAFEIKEKRFNELKRGGLFRRKAKDNIDDIWAITGGMTYIGAESYQTATVKNLIYFGNGVMTDDSFTEARVNGLNKNLSGTLESVIRTVNGELVENKNIHATLKLSVLIIPHKDGIYSSIVAPAKVLRSIIFRLYYMDGAGLKHFVKMDMEEDPRLNTKMYTYKVDWASAD